MGLIEETETQTMDDVSLDGLCEDFLEVLQDLLGQKRIFSA